MKYLIPLLAFYFLIGCDGEKNNETNPPEAVSVNPNLKYEIKGDAVTITGCDKKASGHLIIPATIKGKPVTSIATSFYRCSNLTSITIPDGITSIGTFAFRYCTSLTRITIPDSVTSIGDDAFSFCSALTSITIPDGVTSIGENAFDNTRISYDYTDNRLNYLFSRSGQIAYLIDGSNASGSVIIPTSVNSAQIKLIADGAFSNCNSLTSITIGNGVTSIGRFAFSGCTNLTTVNFLGDAPKILHGRFRTRRGGVQDNAFEGSSPTIYREADAKDWGDTLAGRPVKLITEKP